MARYGNYETGRELSRSGLVVVLAARPADASGPDAFAVKVCHASGDILGAEAARAAVSEFLARAKVQRRAAGPHWAPVFEAAACEEGAFSVTSLYARTAQRLVAGRIKLDAASLRAIVRGVLGGLIQLQTTCGRSHGAVKVSNVLIGGVAPAAITEVFLSDPTGAEKERGAPTVAGDLRAVGEIIHLLMLHEAPMARGGGTIPMSPAWARLGPGAQKWLDFCNQLLDPDLASRMPVLEEVLAAVPLPVKRKRSTPLLIAGVAVALAAGGAWFAFRGQGGGDHSEVKKIAPADATHWELLAAEYASWFEPFLNAALEERSKFERDPFLVGLVAALGPSPDKLRFSDVTGALNANVTAGHIVSKEARTDYPEMLTQDALRRLAFAEQQVAAVKKRLALDALPGAWPRFGAMQEAAKLSEKRKWAAIGAHLRSRMDKVKPNGDLMASLLDIKSSDEVCAGIMSLGAICQSMDEADDEGLRLLNARVTDKLNELPNDPGEIKTSLAERQNELKQVVDALNSRWKDVDKELFRARPLDAYRAAEARPGSLAGLWVKDVAKDDFALPTSPDPRKAPEWLAAQTTLKVGVRGRIEKLSTSGEEPDAIKAFQGRADELVERWSKCQALTRSRSRESEVATTTVTVQNDVDRLMSDINSAISTVSQDKDQVIATLRSDTGFVINSVSLKEAWNRQLDGMIERAHGNTRQIGIHRDRVQSQLTSLLESFPEPKFSQPARPWQADLSAAARDRKEAAVAAVAGGLDWDDQSRLKPPAALESTRNQYTEWLSNLQKLGVDLAEVETRTDALYGVEERIDQKSLKDIALSVHEAVNTLSLKSAEPAVKKALERIDGALAISASPDTLVAMLDQRIRAPQPDAFAIASGWRLLEGAYSRSPTPEVLRVDLAAHKHLLDALPAAAQAAAARLGESRSEDDRKAAQAARLRELNEELAKQSALRWSAYLLRAAPLDVAPGVEMARAAKKASGADLLACPIPANASFNMLIAGLSLDLGGLDPKSPDKGETIKLVRGFLDSSRGLTGLTLNAAQTEMIAKLDDLTGEKASKQTDPKELGPGRVNWVVASVDEDTISFKPGKDAAQEIAFRRLASADAYVSVTEVSVGLFMDVIKGAPSAEFAQNRFGFVKRAAGESDGRDGPRSWQWVNDSEGGHMEVAEQWVRAGTAVKPEFGVKVDPIDGVAAYPDPGNIDNPDQPKAESPMNFVTPESAMFVAELLGCRLPSSGEWNAALADEAQASGAGSVANLIAAITSAQRPANLRDETWNIQFDYTKDETKFKGVSVVSVPYKSSYSVGGATYKTPNNHYAFNDHCLWFRAVGQQGGARFQHLVGNVAEFVLDGFTEDQVQGTPTLAMCFDAIKQKEGTRLSVIGESALSPKVDDPTKLFPLAITRKAQKAYSDVGFRLAFSAKGAGMGGLSLVRKLREQLSSPAYFRAEAAPPG